MKYLVIFLVFLLGVIVGNNLGKSKSEYTSHFITVTKDSIIYKPKPYAVLVKDSALRPPCRELDTIRLYRDTIVNKLDTFIINTSIANNHLDTLQYRWVTNDKVLKPKRWHLGLQSGLGFTPNGIQPFVGVGVTYSIISW